MKVHEGETGPPKRENLATACVTRPQPQGGCVPKFKLNAAQALAGLPGDCAQASTDRFSPGDF